MARLISFSIPAGIFVAVSTSLLGAPPPSPVPTTLPLQGHVVGALSCQSSMCHGGASPARYQYTIWYHNDRHSQAYAALVSSYGVNMAKSLGVASPATDITCTSCHAPLAVKGVDLSKTADVTEGVSCEVCHNGAGSWLRSHTRPDYTYKDRVASGLADLRTTLTRANTCVQCHQVIDPNLIAHGHPALTFELDGQTASEPRHWQEKADWFGAKAWLVGQLVAYREISKGQTQGSDQSRTETQQKALLLKQRALLWLLFTVPAVTAPTSTLTPAGLGYWSEQMAHTISDRQWDSNKSQATLAALAGTSNDFLDTKIDAPEQHARAERLVLALDRLFKAVHPQTKPDAPSLPGDAELTALFDAVNSANFDPKAFSDSLRKFADMVTPRT